MREKTFVLAPDSFKESMTAKEVCIAMEKGLRKVYPVPQIMSTSLWRTAVKERYSHWWMRQAGRFVISR